MTNGNGNGNEILQAPDLANLPCMICAKGRRLANPASRSCQAYAEKPKGIYYGKESCPFFELITKKK